MSLCLVSDISSVSTSKAESCKIEKTTSLYRKSNLNDIIGNSGIQKEEVQHFSRSFLKKTIVNAESYVQ